MQSIVFVLTILLGLLYGKLSAGEDWIHESIDLTINTRFARAESLLTARMAAGDSSLEVQFYYASVLNSKMTHFEKTSEQTHFLNVLKSVITACSEYLEEDSSAYSEAELYFYRGSALGYLAFFQGQTGSWYPAFKNGLKARNDLEKAIEADPELYEAYLGIGAFQYWVSTKFRWIPLVSDKRQEGIENIKKAIEHSTYSRYMAMHQLIYILLDYEAFDEALSYAEKVIAAYPQSPFMWWAYAHTLYKMKRNEEALGAYEHLLGLIESDPASNPMHWVACHVKMAEIHQRLGNVVQCRAHCEKVLNRNFTEEELTDPGKKRLQQAREMLDNIQ